MSDLPLPEAPRPIQPLPGEINVCTAEMSVSCSLTVYRLPEIEMCNDRTWPEIEVRINQFCDAFVGYLSCTKGFNMNR